MGKKLLLAGLTIIMALSFVTVNFAAPEGNKRKGKYLFRKSCRSCHSEAGVAKELSPISKTQADWEKVFSNESYKDLPCKEEWEKQSDQDLLDIYTYMYKHAFDSPSPLKCK
ncbi:MAG: cytochrome c [Syntrophobacterales bacterium]|jgi:cytochrome c5